MPEHANAAIARAFNDAYNARDWDAAVALTSDDVEITNVATGQVFRGAAGVRCYLAGWATAFPDSTAETTMVVADEAAAVLEFTGRGTQTGPLAGPAGDLPPSGRAVAIPFLQMLELRQGKIARARLYLDLGTLLRQLGVTDGLGQAES